MLEPVAQGQVPCADPSVARRYFRHALTGELATLLDAVVQTADAATPVARDQRRAEEHRKISRRGGKLECLLTE
ncbi:MAG: hypothetical protein L0H63_14685 [Nitrococcus sp.]|nr:hypothetical protein [Nitrococcus sp.]